MTYSFASSTAATSVVGTTETSLLASPPISLSPTGGYQGVSITGMISITNSTALTAVVRVRNGSGTAGTTIGVPYTVTTVSGNLYNIPFAAFDSTNPPASQYNVTWVAGAGVATATTNFVTIGVEAVGTTR